jgi:hypothetical protein
MKMSWYVYPNPPESIHIQDEYVIDGCRVRMGGNTIDVESGDKDLAQKIVDGIVELLHRHLPGVYRAVAEEEFLRHTASDVGMPVGIQSRWPRMTESVRKERVYQAVREVRNEMLAGADAALRRCYDYLQSARERGDDAIFDLYKVVETIENVLGGEEKAGQILHALKEIKALKRAANEPTGDERHAPKDPASTPPPADLGQAWENTKTVVRAYEVYVASRK